MDIELTDNDVEVIGNCIRCTRDTLRQQINKWERANEQRKMEICKHQLEEVENVMKKFLQTEQIKATFDVETGG